MSITALLNKKVGGQWGYSHRCHNWYCKNRKLYARKDLYFKGSICRQALFVKSWKKNEIGIIKDKLFMIVFI